MLDLFCGIGGASAAMRARGWRVVSVDLEERFEPTLVADATQFSWIRYPRLDLLWASPPCTEFSRESMPWCKTGIAPSLDLVEHTLRIIRECEPRYWAIENVRGSVRWLTPLLGAPVHRAGSAMLWGRLPPLLIATPRPFKERLSSTRRAERSAIPLEISHAVASSIERAIAFGSTHASAAGTAQE